MKERILNTKNIALINLLRRPLRTAGILSVVGIFAFALFGGSFVSISLGNGLDSMRRRLGADIMAVPSGYEAYAEGALLRGEPSAFYFSGEVIERVGQIEGIDTVSPQLYIASIDSEHCSIPVQLIGFEPDTDFVIKPWIAQILHREVNDGEIIAGALLNVKPGDVIRFFNREYTVAAKLGSTATGFDTSVFINMATAKVMLDDAQSMGYYKSADESGDTPVSSLMIKVADGEDISSVARKIRIKNNDIAVMIPASLFSGIAKNLGSFSAYVAVLSGLLWLISIAVLAVIFAVSISERRREFSVYRTVGGTRRHLTSLVLTESAFISLAGGIAGVAVAALIVFPFGNYISYKLQMPFLLPDAWQLALLFILSLALSFAAGPLSALRTAIKIGEKEAYAAMKEGE